MLPLIGVAASISLVENGPNAGSERFFAGSDYLSGIYKSGGIPVILPPVNGLAEVERQLQVVQGLLLIGGYDLDPLIYGQEPSELLGPVFPERDKYEIMAVHMAVCKKIPILGICRGLQVINAAFGGSLYQDISLNTEPVVQHYQKSHPQVVGHSVNIYRQTELYKIFEQDIIRVNSFHHQAVREVAPGFVVSARTRDNIIEGIENAEAPIIGVQWHPEIMTDRYPAMMKIFQWLVESAKINC